LVAEAQEAVLVSAGGLDHRDGFPHRFWIARARYLSPCVNDAIAQLDERAEFFDILLNWRCVERAAIYKHFDVLGKETPRFFLRSLLKITWESTLREFP